MQSVITQRHVDCSTVSGKAENDNYCYSYQPDVAQKLLSAVNELEDVSIETRQDRIIKATLHFEVSDSWYPDFSAEPVQKHALHDGRTISLHNSGLFSLTQQGTSALSDAQLLERCNILAAQIDERMNKMRVLDAPSQFNAVEDLDVESFGLLSSSLRLSAG